MIFKKHINMKVYDSTIFEVSNNKKKLIYPEDCQRYIDTICDNTTEAYILPSVNNSITLFVESTDENMVDNIMLILKSWINKHYTKEVFERKEKIFIVTILKKVTMNINNIHLILV